MSEHKDLQTRPENTTEATTTEATREPERYATPAVDIFETKEGLTVVADLPGVSRGDIDINVEDNILTIKGVNRADAARDYGFQEFAPVSFFRQFTLGEKIDQERIQAEARNGVLTLTLPFAEAARPRQIPVNVA